MGLLPVMLLCDWFQLLACGKSLLKIFCRNERQKHLISRRYLYILICVVVGYAELFLIVAMKITLLFLHSLYVREQYISSGDLKIRGLGGIRKK